LLGFPIKEALQKELLMDELTVEKTVTLNADASYVWEALVNPELTKEYMFGCEVVSDWKAKSKILWRRFSKGKEKVYIEGVIIKIDTNKLLQYIITGTNAGYVDTPANYIKVTYRLTRKFGKTELTITQGDYAKVEDGKRRYGEANEGLEYILDGLKTLIEERPTLEKKSVKKQTPEKKEDKDLNTSNWLPD
jgi:uncharacterized protein YndB with AHSA1/START domain